MGTQAAREGALSPGSDAGPEVSAILVARRWALVAVTVVSAVGFAIAVAPVSLDSSLGRVGLLAMATLVVVGVLESDRPLGLWLLVTVEALISLARPLGVGPSAQSDPSVAIFIAVLFAITLLPRLAGLVLVRVSVGLLLPIGFDSVPVLSVGGVVLWSTEVTFTRTWTVT